MKMNIESAFQLTARAKKILAVLAIAIAIQGTVGFAMFVLEEGMQTLMFSAFSYRNVKDYIGLAKHVQTMEGMQAFSEPFIRYIGWLSPLMYAPYLKYAEANQAYIYSLKNEIRANAYADEASQDGMVLSQPLQGGATAKQWNYIGVLARQKDIGIKNDYAKLSKQQASDCIGFLLNGAGECVLLA